MMLYKLSRWFYLNKMGTIAFLFVKLNRLVFSCEIPASANLHSTVVIKHGGLGVVIHDQAVIGEGSVIYHGVTIGGRENRGTPVIGKHVYIGAGAKILGDVVIEDRVKVGANAVILKSVKAGMTVVGVPGRVC